MLRYKLIMSILISLLITACGGGGGGGGDTSGGSVSGGNGGSTSITASPASLSFTAVEYSATADSKTVKATFKGDGLIIGYPTGVRAESWLAVDSGSFTNSPVTAKFSASAAGLGKGTYTTTIRLVTGKEDGSQIKYVDIPVTFVVVGGLNTDKDSLQFSMMEASALPASQTIKLHSETSPAGWQLTVQYNETASDWLTLGASSGTITNGDASVSVTTKELPLGNYSANIVLSDSNGQVRDTIPVSYQVTPGFSISGLTDKSITAQANVEDMAWPIVLHTQFDSSVGSKLQWKIESNKPWLIPVSGSGNFSTDQNIQLMLLPDQLMFLNDGEHEVLLTLSVPDSSITPRTISVHLSLDLHPTLTVTGLDASPASLSYLVNNSSNEAGLAKSFKVVSNAGTAFNGQVNWNAVSGSPWLSVINSSGDTNTQSTLQVKVNKSELEKMPNGSYNTSISLTANNARYKTNLLNFSMNLSLAEIENIAPYMAYTGRTEPIIIRGNSFASQPAMKINIGGHLVNANVVNDTEIHINYPSLSDEQRFTLTISNELQIARGGADLVFKHPPVYTAQKISLTNLSQRSITLDPERQAILLSSRYFSDEVTRLRLTTNGWEIDSFAAPKANSATISLDGKELLVTLADQSVTDSIVHLDPNTLAIKKTENLSNDFYERYDTVMPLNDGKTIVIDSDQTANSMYYPSQEIFNLPSWLSNVDAILSRDRGFMLLRDRNQAPEAYSYDINGSKFTRRSFEDGVFNTNQISMNGDATRIVAKNSVYDRDFKLLGKLDPVVPAQQVAVTPNGKYVYVASTDDTYSYSYYFKRYNISAASGPYIADNNSPAINLDANDVPISIKVSDDGGALFVLASHVDHPYATAANLYIFPITN